MSGRAHNARMTEIAGAEAVERGGVESHCLVVEVARARGIGRSAIADRRAIAVAGALEVAADLLLRLLAATLGTQLQPLRHQPVVAL